MNRKILNTPTLELHFSSTIEHLSYNVTFASSFRMAIRISPTEQCFSVDHQNENWLVPFENEKNNIMWNHWHKLVKHVGFSRKEEYSMCFVYSIGNEMFRHLPFWNNQHFSQFKKVCVQHSQKGFFSFIYSVGN